MPSAEHESPLALIDDDPEVVAWLLTDILQSKTPDYHHIRPQPTDIRALVPRTYRADGILVFCDPDDRPQLAVVIEVQRGWDRRKRRTWKVYVAHVEAELDVTTELIVYCPNSPIETRYRNLLERDGGRSLRLTPFFVVPEDVPLILDLEVARTNPSHAVMSAIFHGRRAGVEAMFPALAQALRSVSDSKAIKYYDYLLSGLSEELRARWEAFMSTTVSQQYRSELFRKMADEAEEVGLARGEEIGEARGEARGEAIGEARGRASAILTVLEKRRVHLSADAHDQIAYCTDVDQLDEWLERALTATTAEDVIG